MKNGEIPTTVVIGGGPSSWACIHALIDSGVSEHDILVIRPHKNRKNQDKDSESSGFIKNNLNTNQITPATISALDLWGGNCLPITESEFEYEGMDYSQFLEIYGSICQKWSVQAFSSEYKKEIYPMTGETNRILNRKNLAKLISENCPNAYHTRLAVSNTLCGSLSKCLDGCPNSAITNSSNLEDEIRIKYPNVTFKDGFVDYIDTNNRKIITLKSDYISYKQVFVAAGAINSVNIIQKILLNNVELFCTPVAIVPIIFRKRSSEEDFFKSITLSDLYSPIEVDGKIISLCQIYLPSLNLLSKMMNSNLILRFLFKILQNFKFSDTITRRLGVGMFFFPNQPLADTYFDIDKLKLSSAYLKKYLDKFIIFVLNSPRFLLLNGKSHHIGAAKIQGYDFLESTENKFLIENDIFVVDSTILKKIPIGPHTASSSAITFMYVRNKSYK